MVRVGLITFHRAINFGAVLQTYALQKKINEQGAECKVIDFRCKAIEAYYRPLLVYKGSFISMLKQTIKALPNYYSRKNKRKKFEVFIEHYLDLLKPVDPEIENLNMDFDVFVTGSDQVFNTDISGKESKVYYLSFAQKPRYSYAASFGRDSVSERDKEWVCTELKKFHSLSVREESGVDIIKSLIDIQARVHMDPTLLLSSSEWRNIEKKPKGFNEPFILVYNMLTSDLLYEAALELFHKKGIKVVFVNYKSRNLKKKYNMFVYKDDLSPENFLWLIDNASYILTSSFHGTVFSILFHKKFVSILPKDEPKNVRIESLLKMIGLFEKLYVGEFDISHIDETVNWEVIEEVLKEYRKDSFNYINEMIESI